MISLDEVNITCYLESVFSYVTPTSFNASYIGSYPFVYKNEDGELHIFFLGGVTGGNYTSVRFANDFSAISNFTTEMKATEEAATGETFKAVGISKAFAISNVTAGTLLGGKYISTTTNFAVEIK